MLDEDFEEEGSSMDTDQLVPQQKALADTTQVGDSAEDPTATESRVGHSGEMDMTDMLIGLQQMEDQLQTAASSSVSQVATASQYAAGMLGPNLQGQATVVADGKPSVASENNQSMCAPNVVSSICSPTFWPFR